MNRSIVIVVAVLVVAGIGVAAWMRRPEGPRYEGQVKHVIVISMDTTRADFFGCYGNKRVKTPAVDALAAESVQFMDYMTAVPTTLASHTSLFTGKYPHSHGVPRNGFVVNASNVMLSEILKGAGFHTAGFIASFALDKRFNFSQGFDDWNQDFDRLIDQYGGDQDQRRGDRVTDAVISYLEKGVPRNLFLFVHYFDPHLPYDAPAPYDSMYDPEGHLGVVDVADVRAKLAFKHPDGMAMAKRFAMQYAGEISYTDEQVGRLIDYLRKKGILDDSLLVLTSDHGESLYEQPLEIFDHGRVLAQSTLHAVGMMRFPKAKFGGTKLVYTISSVDVLPTILKYLNLSDPPGVEGEAIQYDPPPDRDYRRVRFAEATKPHEDTEIPGEWYNSRKSRCVREGKWKFIYTPFTQEENLYDVRADAMDRRDLMRSPTPEIEAVASELRKKLEAWATEAKPLQTDFDLEHREDTIRRLGGLGYVEGGESEPTSQPALKSRSQPASKGTAAP